MSAKWSDPREQTGHGRRLQGILGRAGPRGRCKRLYGHRIRARSRRALIFFCQFMHLPRVKIHDRIYVFRVANVAELVDAPDLGSGAERCESSSLSVRTIKRKPLFYKINFKYVNGFVFSSYCLAFDRLLSRFPASGPSAQSSFAVVGRFAREATFCGSLLRITPFSDV